jgi:hypothetical protein
VTTQAPAQNDDGAADAEVDVDFLLDEIQQALADTITLVGSW